MRGNNVTIDVRSHLLVLFGLMTKSPVGIHQPASQSVSQSHPRVPVARSPSMPLNLL